MTTSSPSSRTICPAAPLRVRRSSPERSADANDTLRARKIECGSRSASAYDMLTHHQMFIWAISLESAFLVAVGAVVLGLIHWKNRKKRLPFTQKILRPPGESLRIRLIELDEKLNDRLIQLFLSAYSPW
jgi:hypothetical protein